MSRQADPEASVWQIWMPGADRSDTLSVARPAPGQALPGEFFLDDGTPALIWPLLTTDAETLRDVFRRLSPESRQHRFLHVLDELDDSMIRRLVGSVDGVHHIALFLVALPPGGKEEPVGVARLVQRPDDPATADVAVTVVDDWQEPAPAQRSSRRCCSGARRQSPGCARLSRRTTALRWRCSPERGVCPRACLSREWSMSRLSSPRRASRAARWRRSLTSGCGACGRSSIRFTYFPSFRRPTWSR